MGQLCLMLARTATSAWVGAAVLFVITSVREVRYAGFDSATRDILAALRFPPYYLFGFTAVGIGLVATAIALAAARISRLRGAAALVLLIAAALLMAVDYVWIYGPLAEMIVPPGAPKPARFQTLHVASEWINTADVALVLLAALLLNWPAPRPAAGS